MISPSRLGVIIAHELRLASRDPLPAMVLVVFPIITIAFLRPALGLVLAHSGYPHANGADQLVPGQAVLSAFFLVSMITTDFFNEHGWATWDRLRASQATSLEILVGKAVPRVVVGVTQFVVILGAGVLAFELDVRGDVIAIVPLVVVFSICLVLLGLAVTAVFRTAQQAVAFGTVGMVLFGAVGGALVPFNVLPAWAQAVAPITPTYWAMSGLRSVILDGRGIGAVTAPIAVLLLMTLVFTLVVLRRFRVDEPKVGWI